MAIVQSSALVTTQGTLDAVFSLSGVTAGNALVIEVAAYSTIQADSIKFPTGWTVYQLNSPGGYGSAAIGVLTGVAAGAQSITLQTTGGSSGAYFTGKIHEVSYLVSTPVDTGAVVTGTTTGTSLTLTSPAALAQASEIAFSVIAYDGTNNNTDAIAASSPWGSLWTENNGASYETGAAADQTYSAGGTPTITWSGLVADTYGFAGLIVPLKLASSTDPANAAVTVQPTASVSAQSSQSAAAAASIVFGAAATAVALATALATGNVAPTASGTATAINPAQSAPSIAPSAAANLAASQNATATATVAPVAAVTASSTQTAQATATVQPQASGTLTPVGTNAATASPSVQFGARAQALSSQAAQAAASVAPGAAVQILQINAAQADAQIGAMTASGLLVATQQAQAVASYAPHASAQATATLGANSSALITPQASGALTLVNSYLLDPRYYAALPARAFYATGFNRTFYAAIQQRNFYGAVSTRGFYAAIPARPFYALCSPTMTTLFDPKDPRETVVLTFDASNDLAAGETLIGTPSVAVTVSRGSDPSPGAVVSAPQINAAALTVGAASIAIGHAVQAVASGGVDGAWYLVAITCSTSNPDKILTLKAILPVTAS